MTGTESKRRLRVALVESSEEEALRLCDWISRYGYEPLWLRMVEDLRVQWSMLTPDAVVLGPSFDPSSPPCVLMETVCPGVPVLLASKLTPGEDGPVWTSCRRETCSVLTEACSRGLMLAR